MDLRRVAVIGTSCSGKTTFAAALAARQRASHIELDALHWRPGWVEAPQAAFKADVAAAIAAERWVCDGNYGTVRDLVWGRATTVIWLDYRFTTVMRRALYRTLRRAITREELFSGNRESIRMVFFSRRSILWWVVTTHRRRREQYSALFAGSAFRHLERVVLTSPAAATHFLNASERVAPSGAARHTSPGSAKGGRLP